MDEARRRASALGAAVVMGWFTAGCVAGAAGDEEAAATETGTVMRTIVTVHQDGTPEIHASRVTLEEQRRDVALLGSSPNAAGPSNLSPTSCDITATKLFDGESYTGNYACFQGFGWVDLTQICRRYLAFNGHFYCAGTWDQAVRSYWSGQNFGTFKPSDYSCWENMPKSEARATVGACAQRSGILELNLSTF